MRTSLPHRIIRPLFRMVLPQTVRLSVRRRIMAGASQKPSSARLKWQVRSTVNTAVGPLLTAVQTVKTRTKHPPTYRKQSVWRKWSKIKTFGPDHLGLRAMACKVLCKPSLWIVAAVETVCKLMNTGMVPGTAWCALPLADTAQPAEHISLPSVPVETPLTKAEAEAVRADGGGNCPGAVECSLPPSSRRARGAVGRILNAAGNHFLRCRISASDA